MKKEVLRINDLHYAYAANGGIKDISLSVLEGECLCFMGLAYSGKDTVLQILEGQEEISLRRQKFYLEGKRILGAKELYDAVYRMCPINYVIDGWTVAEYIGLIHDKSKYFMIRKRALEEQARLLFEELDIDLRASDKLRQLSETEKRIVDVAKAIYLKKKIIVLEDEFDGMSLADVEAFRRMMKRLIRGKIAVIASSHSDKVMSLLADKYVFFSKGRIVKKCKRDFIKDERHMEIFLLGAQTYEEAGHQEISMEKEDRKVAYRVCGWKHSEKPLEFKEGEIVTFLTLNRKEKENLFYLLSGRRTNRNLSYETTDKIWLGDSYQHFVEERIASVRFLGSSEEIFTDMPVEGNLILPSLRKISRLDYILFSFGIFKSLMAETDMSEVRMWQEVGKLSINDLIRVTLERWYLYHPKVLVLLDPFALCDAKGVGIVKKYLRKFAARGTSVIVLVTREEYVKDITDQMIWLR